MIFFKLNNLTIIYIVLDRSEDQSHVITCHNIHHPKTPCLNEHASSNAPRHTEARLRARITLHVSSSVPDHTMHNPETVMINKRSYIKVNLLHPQGINHFSQHFLHTLSQFHYRLEYQSANVSARTFSSTTKTHRRCAGSRYCRTRAFSVAVATQPFSRDRLYILNNRIDK
jgi:hypothetical protein